MSTQDKLIMESWRQYLDKDEEEIPSAIEEQQQLDEALPIIAVGATFLAKFFIALFWGLQNKEKINEISQNVQNQDKVPEQIKTLFRQIDVTLVAAAGAQPELSKAVEATGSKWNPLNWKSNVLLSLISKWTTPEDVLDPGQPLPPHPGAPEQEIPIQEKDEKNRIKTIN